MVSHIWQLKTVATVLLLSTSLALVQRYDKDRLWDPDYDGNLLIDRQSVWSGKRQSERVERNWRHTGREDVTRDRLLRSEWHSERSLAAERKTPADESDTDTDENRHENRRSSKDDNRERSRSFHNKIRREGSSDRDLDSVERERREDLKRNQASDLTHRQQVRRENSRELVHREEVQSRYRYEALDERRNCVLDQRRDDRRDASRQQNDRENTKQRISREGQNRLVDTLKHVEKGISERIQSDRRQSQTEFPSDRLRNQRLEDSFEWQYREGTMRFTTRDEPAQTDRREDSQNHRSKQIEDHTDLHEREEVRQLIAHKRAARQERLREDGRTDRHELQREDSREQPSRVVLHRFGSSAERRKFQIRKTASSDKVYRYAEDRELEDHQKRIVFGQERHFTRSDKDEKFHQMKVDMHQDRLLRSRERIEDRNRIDRRESESNTHSSQDSEDSREQDNNEQVDVARRSLSLSQDRVFKINERNAKSDRREDTLDLNREKIQTECTEDLHRAVDREVIRKANRDRNVNLADRRENLRTQLSNAEIREHLERSGVPTIQRVPVERMARQEGLIRETRNAESRRLERHNIPDEMQDDSRLRRSEKRYERKDTNVDALQRVTIRENHREDSRRQTGQDHSESIDRRMTERATEHYTQGATKYTKLSLLTMIQGTLLAILLMKTLAFDNIKTGKGLLYRAMDFVGIAQLET